MRTTSMVVRLAILSVAMHAAGSLGAGCAESGDAGNRPDGDPSFDAGSADDADTADGASPVHVCLGSALTCADLALDACADRPGCSVSSTRCVGVSTPCEDLTEAVVCELAPGCRWLWSSEDETRRGEQGFPCRDGDTCDANLLCRSDVCIPAGALGQRCLPDGSCHVGSRCFEGICLAAGGNGEPCFPDGTCLESFVCEADVCHESIMARFCHCLVRGGVDIRLRLQAGSVSFPFVLTAHCSPCQPISTGRIRYEVFREDGTSRASATAAAPTAPINGSLSIFDELDSLAFYDEACDASVICR